MNKGELLLTVKKPQYTFSINFLSPYMKEMRCFFTNNNINYRVGLYENARYYSIIANHKNLYLIGSGIFGSTWSFSLYNQEQDKKLEVSKETSKAIFTIREKEKEEERIYGINLCSEEQRKKEKEWERATERYKEESLIKRRQREENIEKIVNECIAKNQDIFNKVQRKKTLQAILQFCIEVEEYGEKDDEFETKEEIFKRDIFEKFLFIENAIKCEKEIKETLSLEGFLMFNSSEEEKYEEEQLKAEFDIFKEKAIDIFKARYFDEEIVYDFIERFLLQKQVSLKDIYDAIYSEFKEILYKKKRISLKEKFIDERIGLIKNKYEKKFKKEGIINYYYEWFIKDAKNIVNNSESVSEEELLNQIEKDYEKIQEYSSYYDKFLTVYNSQEMYFEWTEEQIENFRNWEKGTSEKTEEKELEYKLVYTVISKYEKALFYGKSYKIKPTFLEFPKWMDYVEKKREALVRIGVLEEKEDGYWINSGERLIEFPAELLTYKDYKESLG